MPGNLTLFLHRHDCPTYGTATGYGDTGRRVRRRRTCAVGAYRGPRCPVTRTYGVGVLGEHVAEQGRDCLDAEVRLEPHQDVACACAGGDVLDAIARAQTELKAFFEGL
jgi:hypothetical protein